jgi:hypothetical protein
MTTVTQMQWVYEFTEGSRDMRDLLGARAPTWPR